MNWRRLCLTLGLLLSFGLCLTLTANAAVSDFVITDFDADYTLNTDDPQGTLTIHEELQVDFRSYNHGILRALPKKYNSQPLHLQVEKIVRDEISEPYSTYSSNGNLVLKIGDANRTITGQHQYDIEYKVTDVMRFVGDRAELDWDVNGTGWQQSFLHVKAQLHVPASLIGQLNNDYCFTGPNGSTQHDCTIAKVSDGTMYNTTRTLTSGETLTFNESFPVGSFTPPTLADKWADYGRQVAPAVLIPLAALLIVGSVWRKQGRDAKGRGTIVPEYGPPADLRPAEIDVLLHNKLGKNAVSATIIDLAIRKYLRIEETESKGILGLGKQKQYSFVKLATPPASELQSYEAQVLTGIFGGSTATDPDMAQAKLAAAFMAKDSGVSKLFKMVAKDMLPRIEPAAVGEKVEMKSLRNTFYLTLQSIQKSIPKSLQERGFFRTNPATVGNVWLILAVALLFGSFFLMQFSVLVMVGTIFAALIIFIFARLMPSRTSQGAATKDSAEGLKMYLETAEKDRLAMLQSPDAPYAQASAKPTKTVDLFEKLLPYAMVLGVEQQWAKQFEGIYTTPPDWYAGNWSTFNAVYLADSLNDSMSAMNSSFAAPSSSGSGGSAGGGGGGGGGGGW